MPVPKCEITHGALVLNRAFTVVKGF